MTFLTFKFHFILVFNTSSLVNNCPVIVQVLLSFKSEITLLTFHLPIIMNNIFMSHLLCRNDPWASRRFCYDKSCVTCRSRSWLQEQTKAAKKAKEKLPDELEKTTVNQCRREGINYTIQCLTCIPLGLKTLYRGEGARSARQRQGEHFRDLENGTVASPLVIHALEEHGGQKPEMLAIVDKLEPSALYRAAHESVKISKLPQGPTKMNRCQEWGAPRVPVVSVMGGGDEPEGGDDGEAGVVRRSLCARSGDNNPRMEWTAEMMEKVKEGSIKRIKLVTAWDRDRSSVDAAHGQQQGQAGDRAQPVNKRRRLDPGIVVADLDLLVGPSLTATCEDDDTGGTQPTVTNIEDSVVVVDKVELDEKCVVSSDTTRGETGGDGARSSIADDDAQGGEENHPRTPVEPEPPKDCSVIQPKVDSKEQPVTANPETAIGLDAKNPPREPTFWYACTDIRYREDRKTPRTGSLSSNQPLQPSLAPRSSACAGVGPTKEGPRPGMRKPRAETRAGLQSSMSSWLGRAQPPRMARSGSMRQPRMTDAAPTTTLTTRTGGAGEPRRKGGGAEREGGGGGDVAIERRIRSNTIESGEEIGVRPEPERD